MNGILVVNKEKGYTSRDVINVLNKEFGTKKIGHTGTLDPIASGVLVVCIGKGLKLSELLVSTSKEYIAKVKLGIVTDTLDITGNVISNNDVIDIDEDKIRDVLDRFKGNIRQEVPLYSSVHVDGKRLYEYARNGIDVVLPSRDVNIMDIELLAYDSNNKEFSFRCVVSKGTYIRSLIRDIGQYLGCGACMLELNRTKQGMFDIKDSYTLDDIKNNNYKLLGVDDVLDIPVIRVDNEMEFRIRNGQKLRKFYDYEGLVMIKDSNNNLIAIYKDDLDGLVRPYRMFI